MGRRRISQAELDATNGPHAARVGPPPYEYKPPQYSPIEKAIGAALFVPTVAVMIPFAIGIFVATTLFREPD